MIPHRSTALITIVVFVALVLVIFSSSPVTDPSTGEEVSGPAKYVPHPKLPSLNNLHLPSFHPTVHTPPEPQPNSTSGESKWFSDWSWINPFSSSITLDENRSVLPPLRNRPFIYTYYEPNKGNDREEDNADAQLLLAWRRAWFAQGFRPVILGPGEAMNNQLYELVQPLSLKPELESELFRWLAWGHMGDGMLADWHCFPMARYDNALLTYLRRGTDPALITRFDGFGNALFSGEKSRINDAIKEAMNKVDDKSTSLIDLLPTEFFKVEEPSALALYDSAAITSHYPTVAEKIVSSPTAGRLALAELINAHLHNTFQNSFPAGVAVLKPFPEHTTALVEPALRLAKALVQCPSSPVPHSCPPNSPKCHPCDAEKPMQVSQPATYRNTTQVFTIGTLPHPFTLISLQQDSTEVTTRHIRRETDRDVWLAEVTKEHLGTDIGGSARAVVFKRAVADDAVVGTSLWMTVESLPPQAGQSLPSELLDEFEWQFGFKIPRDGKVDAKNEEEKKESVQQANPSEQGVEKEYGILKQAREYLKGKDTNRIGITDVAEAWNLADTEVWRFVRAYRARSVVERKKWEEEEKDFIGAKPKV
ncbi:hypothetical protein AtubIFM56815_006317 [Aspergillus tubingensis]|uniref:Uncharacterized protein n=1 Tax=Aspergillus tubingensis TaxID=5068 RepID=A0A8H3SP49_ASPTU|nr:EF-hand domain pair family protein [Aspergillus tubingensis]GFN13196.1 EF-hand domain pair family protein [Aspergillus tubingensis]GLA61349.1 hypothetical protein AtubIFM54640_001868 [Aspergillus tubingensis]GLA82138.1 hypothetical protein AtubIFM56815_006317 [Aspergillus tubingensis]GLA95865.1 hypothetical protein AtubIFM57143_002886 [Aspergillus tubingensis]GLB18378.1 hypothetical protein AtubIFM61612_008269 [Aspergillus tubingensis]